MDTSEFEAIFLGQEAIVSIDEKGSLVSIKLKLFPHIPVEISEEHKRELEEQYEDDIVAVLRENYQDGDSQENHIRTESDKGNFV